MAAARVAVELGYAIAADPGPSGRLGHWRIAGIPDEVLDVHSKRAAEIDAAVAERGYSSYRARNIAARDTRDVKRHTPIGELMPRWRQELAEVGWTVPDLVAAVDLAAQQAELPGPLSEREVLRITREVLGPESRLSTEKVFTAADVVVNVAPSLFGRPLEELATVVGRVLAAPESVPLLRVRGARQQAYATASVLAIESAIAEVVAKGTATLGAPTAPAAHVEQAMLGAAIRVGRPLTAGQEAAVRGICSDGRRVSLVLGVAGSGKTTAIRCVAEAYTAAGYQVIGTATSGQAARTLGREAGIAGSRTLASLLWRLDHHSLNLTAGHVVVLDEAGMTDDPAMLRLLTAADIAGAKVVLVGDHRQLDAVGPGGALRAVLNRHHGQVHVLYENVRQDDPGERQALAELRAGDVAKAVAWYAEHDRIRIAPDRDEALRAMVDAWAADACAGKDAAMYAWRRTNVDELNRRARDRWAIAGRLHGPDLAADGRRYAAGDLDRHPRPRCRRQGRHQRTRRRRSRRPPPPCADGPHGRRPPRTPRRRGARQGPPRPRIRHHRPPLPSLDRRHRPPPRRRRRPITRLRLDEPGPRGQHRPRRRRRPRPGRRRPHPRLVSRPPGPLGHRLRHPRHPPPRRRTPPGRPRHHPRSPPPRPPRSPTAGDPSCDPTRPDTRTPSRRDPSRRLPAVPTRRTSPTRPDAQAACCRGVVRVFSYSTGGW